MSVHYKFKSTRDFDTITFDGLHISVGDLKKAIIHQKRLGKITDFDLQITNAQTKEEYADDAVLIPKNTSLVIARIPLTNAQKKNIHLLTETILPNVLPKTEGTSLDLSKMTGTEEEKIQEMIHQSTIDYDPKSYQKLRGPNMNSEVPVTYRCNKCKKAGHWIKNCPLNLIKDHSEVVVKRNTGIPKSFRNKEEKPPEIEQEPKIAEEKVHIPEDLICSICNDIFVDAVMIPCCGSSFCDDCVRSALLDSEDNECPDCKERGTSPGSLIPNRFLRNSVNAFKNESGYKEAEPKKTAIVTQVNVNKNISDEQTIEEQTEEKSDPKAISSSEIPGKLEEKKDKEESSKEAHDEIESDYDDNITVTMPTKKMDGNYAKLIDRKDRSQRSARISTSENSSNKQFQLSYSDSHREEKHPDQQLYVQTEKKVHTQGHDGYKYENGGHNIHNNSKQQQGNMIQSYSYSKKQEYPMRPNNIPERYPGPAHRHGAYHQVQTQPPPLNSVMEQMAPFNNMFNQMGLRPDNRYPQYGRPVYPNVNPMLMPMRNDVENSQLSAQSSNLASVYQGVAAKVGTGIIDDPLEAFNRIMKEKEKRKQDSRIMDFRRSRSIDTQHNDHRLSPYDRKLSRQPVREKREHSRDQDRRYNRGREKEKQKSFSRRRSYSYSDRNSRSRSNSSPSYKRRAASPNHRRSSRDRNYADDKFSKGNRNRPSSRDDEYRHGSSKQHFRRSRSRERSFNYQHSRRISSNRVSQNNTKSDKYLKSGLLRPSYDRSSISPGMKGENTLNKIPEVFHNNVFENTEPPPPGFESSPPVYSMTRSCANKDIKSTTPELYDESGSYKHSNQKHDTHISKKRKHSRSLTPKIDPGDTGKSSLETSYSERVKDESDIKRPKKLDEKIESSKVERDDTLNIKEVKNIHEDVRQGISRHSHSPNNRDFKKDNSDGKIFSFRDEKTTKYFEKEDAKIDEKLKDRKKRKKDKTIKKKLKKDKKVDSRKRGQKKSVHDSDSQQQDNSSSEKEQSIKDCENFPLGESNSTQNQANNQAPEIGNKFKNEIIIKANFDEMNLDKQSSEKDIEITINRKEQSKVSFSPEISKLEKLSNVKASGEVENINAFRISPKDSYKISTSKSDLKNFQITVPKCNDERSIEFKNEKKMRSYSPPIKKPIMERLGEKVLDEKINSSSKIKISYSRDNRNEERGKTDSFNEKSDKKRDHRDSEASKYREKDRDRDRNLHIQNSKSDKERLKSSVSEVDRRGISTHYKSKKENEINDGKRSFEKYNSNIKNSTLNEKRTVKYENPFATKNRDFNKDKRDFINKSDRNFKTQSQIDDFEHSKGSCSGSESDERRRRKHKTKKEKSRRLSSESTASERKKHLKSKKRSKSSKKKKKSKK